MIQARPTEIVYPESDGKPMGETDVHRMWMIRIYDLLTHRYHDQNVYVGSDLLLYYEEGDPRKYLVPDNFVVKDCDPGPRRTFKTWEEERVPDVVFEVTSRWTQREDEVFKPTAYARIGVKELFLYDPTADYLDPPLIGHRLQVDGPSLIRPEAGALDCRELGLLLRLESNRLVMLDAKSGQRLLTKAESAEAAHERERAGRERERAAREVAEKRAQAAEAEVERLRQELARRKRPKN